MGALFDAVLGLHDAEDNTAGLGEGLQGIYTKLGQAIVEHLPKVRLLLPGGKT
jgi:hypothetical protein